MGYSEATAYAVLKLYGNAVTILKADKGKTDFLPLVLNSNNRIDKNNWSSNP